MAERPRLPPSHDLAPPQRGGVLLCRPVGVTEESVRAGVSLGAQTLTVIGGMGRTMSPAAFARTDREVRDEQTNSVNMRVGGSGFLRSLPHCVRGDRPVYPAAGSVLECGQDRRAISRSRNPDPSRDGARNHCLLTSYPVF